MPLKAVLFDMDGVIVDTEPLHRKAFYQVFEDLRIQVSDELYSSFTGSATLAVCEKIKQNFGLRESADEIVAFKRKYFKYFFDHDTEFDLLPGVLELIKDYHRKGIKMVLASSAHRNTIQWIFEKFDLEQYFVGKISGADLEESKPHPEIFEKAAEIAGEPRENCMVIEDSTNGILAAHQAGILCAGYQSENSKGQDYSLADLVINDFAELTVEKVSKYFS